MARERKLHLLPDGEAFTVAVERVENGYRVVSSSPDLEAHVVPAVGGLGSVLTSHGSYETHVSRRDGEIVVEIAGERFRFADGDGDAGARPTVRASARAEVKAPMPGKIVQLLVAAGDAVSAGQGVLLFEAMKMQNEIRSPQDGVVGELAVEEGQAVEARDPLFVVLLSK